MFRPGEPTLLFDGPFQFDNAGHPNYDVAEDGRFMMQEQRNAGATQVRLLVNWLSYSSATPSTD